MLTIRGYWFFVVAVAMLAVAVLARQVNAGLGLIALTLLLWFCGQWFLFVIRARIISRRLRLRREVRDERGPVANLWAGRPFKVWIELSLDSWLDLPHVAMVDHIAYAADCDPAKTRNEGPIRANHPLSLEYRILCPAPGKVRFEGVRLQLADFHGLFYHVTFVPGVAVYRVLPGLSDAEGHSASVKRHNLLPPPGVHRLRRPGSGSELLDLRDYLPGDPPKTIAWKVSARRDRLITKEFESEVPVRCTLFVDTSHSVRVGPPGQNALTHLVEIAATVAQAAAGSRDLIGLCLFDDHAATVVRPARGARHLVQLLNVLSEAAGLAPAAREAEVDPLLPLAYGFAQEVYPELMGVGLNSFPFWLPWLRPQPVSTLRHPSIMDRLYGGQAWILLLYLGAPIVIGAAFLSSLDSLSTINLWLLFILPIFYLGLGVGVFIFLAVAFRERRRRAGWRKRLAALLSVQYGMAPGGLGQLLEDDGQFSLLLQRFLADHQIPFSPPLYDRRGRYLFASPEKVKILAGSLVRAVGRGHDNELFVLLVDLLELGDRLDPLLRAVKVALARHHQVLVICPWPPAILPPRRDRRLDTRPTSTPPSGGVRHGLRNAMRQATTRRFHRAFQEARRTFARLGVPMVSARSGDLAQVILDRLNELRGLGRKR